MKLRECLIDCISTIDLISEDFSFLQEQNSGLMDRGAKQFWNLIGSKQLVLPFEELKDRLLNNFIPSLLKNQISSEDELEEEICREQEEAEGRLERVHSHVKMVRNQSDF